MVPTCTRLAELDAMAVCGTFRSRFAHVFLEQSLGSDTASVSIPPARLRYVLRVHLEESLRHGSDRSSALLPHGLRVLRFARVGFFLAEAFNVGSRPCSTR